VLTAIVIVVVVLAAVAVALAASSIRVLREYERAVVFRLGRLMEQRGPGLVLLVPTIDRMVKVSLRTVTLTVAPQEVITRDNVPVRVTAVAYYRVIDPSRAITEVESFHKATLQIAQTALRSVLGGADLDTLLAERERLNEALQHVIDAQTEPWGIKVTTVEIKDVEIPERMQHAIARQAEAERERRAKIINAEGERQAATALAQAAEVIASNPVAIQLRYLQTLREVGGSQSSTVVLPVPMELIGAGLSAAAGARRAPGDRDGRRDPQSAGSPAAEPPGPTEEPAVARSSDRPAVSGPTERPAVAGPTDRPAVAPPAPAPPAASPRALPDGAPGSPPETPS